MISALPTKTERTATNIATIRRLFRQTEALSLTPRIIPFQSKTKVLLPLLRIVGEIKKRLQTRAQVVGLSYTDDGILVEFIYRPTKTRYMMLLQDKKDFLKDRSLQRIRQRARKANPLLLK